jgi:flagellum-specific peptidoglycan hydrolase FlgJ
METLEIRLNEVARIAVRLGQQTGCPAKLLIAQWAIESKWGERPVGHANYFGIKRAARHTKWCTVATEEVFTPAELGAWNHEHVGSPARVIATLPDGRLRVQIDDEFADYDSLDASCQDYAWLITHGEPYCAAWQQYKQNGRLAQLISGVAHAYATAPQYAELALEIADQANVSNVIDEVKTGENRSPSNASAPVGTHPTGS